MRDNQDDYVSQFQYNSVSIVENIRPLIGFDMAWHNSLITKFEIARKRNLLLSINSNQINETRNTDYTVGAGYKFKEVPIYITAGGARKQIKSDLNVRLDYTIKNNLTIIRSLGETLLAQESEVTTGNRSSVIGVTADYVFSEKFSVQFFFDRDFNEPAVQGSGTYTNSETQFGFSMRLRITSYNVCYTKLLRD